MQSPTTYGNVLFPVETAPLLGSKKNEHKMNGRKLAEYTVGANTLQPTVSFFGTFFKSHGTKIY